MTSETRFFDHYVFLQDMLIQLDNKVRECADGENLECTFVDSNIIPWGHITDIALELAWDFLGSIGQIYALKNEDAQEISRAYVEPPNIPSSGHEYVDSVPLDNQHIHLPVGTVGSSKLRKSLDGISINEADDQKLYGEDLGKYIAVKKSDLDEYIAKISDRIVNVGSIMHKSEGEVEAAYQEFVYSLRNEPAPDGDTQKKWYRTNYLAGKPITRDLQRELKKRYAPEAWKKPGARQKKPGGAIKS